VIESVLPSRTAGIRTGESRARASHAGAATLALVVVVPLLGFGAFQFVVWLLSFWLEMADSVPLLLAQ
jgi:hypothetical protein